MDKLGIFGLVGKKTGKHSFNIYDMKTALDSVGGIYIVTKRSKNNEGKYEHKVIYIGETKNLKDRFSNHHRQSCFDKNNSNCICFLQEENESKRLEIEKDLIETVSPPCNRE